MLDLLRLHQQIIDRYKDMIDCFINYLQQNNLLK